MRYAVLISILICVACAKLGGGAAARLCDARADVVVLMQPPTTQAEFDAARATRLAAEREQFYVQRPQPRAAQMLACHVLQDSFLNDSLQGR
jgi:hypothetical protein